MPLFKGKCIYGLSRRNDGNMKLYADDKNLVVESNRKAFLRKKGLDISELIVPESEHKNKVMAVTDLSPGNDLKCDALLTDRNNIILGITVADCLPVYLCDKENSAIGLAHAGWRGLNDGVLEATVNQMADIYNTDPSVLNVLIGPHIKSANYEVGAEVAEKFKTFKGSLSRMEDRYYLDLSLVAFLILSRCGVPAQNIEIDKEDTYISKDLFSFRRDKPQKVEAMLAYLKLVK